CRCGVSPGTGGTVTSMSIVKGVPRDSRMDHGSDGGWGLRQVRLVVARQRDAWDDFVASAGGSFLQSWQWGEFKRRLGWRVLRLTAWRGSEAEAALQVLIKVVPGIGIFCYGAEGPVLRPEGWCGDGTALRFLLDEVHRRVAPWGGI